MKNKSSRIIHGNACYTVICLDNLRKQLTAFSIRDVLQGPKHISEADTSQKMKFSIKNVFNKYDQICRKLCIWSYLLIKVLMENFFVQCEMPIKATNLDER